MTKKIGILGPEGTHSEDAAIYLRNWADGYSSAELILYPDIYECLQAAETGKVDSAFVPVENSLEGSIAVTLDTLARSRNLRVNLELIWPVHNHLLARCGHESIKKIYSHPQPISQCQNYLLRNFPHAEIVKVASTARATEIVSYAPLEEGAAAIGTERAGRLRDIPVITRDIQDNTANCTRFFEVTAAPPDELASTADTVLIVCQIDGSQSGALYNVLGEFAHRNVSLTSIESRPARTELGEYIFFLDLDAHADKEQLEASIEAVARRSIWLKNLGAFPVHMAKL